MPLHDRIFNFRDDRNKFVANLPLPEGIACIITLRPRPNKIIIDGLCSFDGLFKQCRALARRIVRILALRHRRHPKIKPCAVGYLNTAPGSCVSRYITIKR